MTKEDVIRIALDVGFDDGEVDTCQLMLENFAFLVAQQEREACAKMCEQHGYDHYCKNVTDKISKTIRARGQA